MANNPNDGFAGVLAALNAVAELNGSEVKEYPNNWDGIIKAILNLGLIGDANTGEYPPGWEIITDNDGNPIGGDWVGQRPLNGDLWFDTRQGRLMVYMDDEYYQTNGADALTVVSTSQPSAEVIGGLWYNPSTQTLFIYDGTAWVGISTFTGFATDNLPLSTIVNAETAAANPKFTYVSKYLPSDPTDHTQQTLNQWSVKAFLELDEQVKSNTLRNKIHVSATAPTNAAEGDIWSNTTAQDLRVYCYGEWKHAFDAASINSEISQQAAQILANESASTTKFNQIDNTIAALPFSNYLLKSVYETKIPTIESSISSLTNTVGDLDRFALKATTNVQLGELGARVTVLENKPEPDLSPYSTTAELLSAINGLEDKILDYNYAPISYVNSQINAIDIPDISGKLDESTFTTYVADANNVFLKRAGGIVSGTLDMRNATIGESGLDFTSSSHVGDQAFAFKAKSATKPVYFGTGNVPYELSWRFEGNEDFCWKHSDTKVFSITKNGASTSKLDINGVDVGEKLTQLSSQIASVNTTPAATHDHSALEANILALQSQINSGLCQYRIHYSDNAPSAASNGDIWFNSSALKLYVRHSNAWVNPDRVEEDDSSDDVDVTALQLQLQSLTSTVASLGGNDLNLKADLFNAVSTSTSFLDLKSKLMAALSS